MAREGTRSATGNSKPRVFDTPDTAPVIARKPKSKTTTTKSAKPVGVTKTKKVTPAKKAKVTAKKVGDKVKKAVAKKPKAKTATK